MASVQYLRHTVPTSSKGKVIHMKIIFSEFTSPGLVRENNQDSIFSGVSDGVGLFVVADGMGGHFGGEIASGRLTDAMKIWWNGFQANKCSFDECRDQLKEIITNVNNSIYAEYSSQGKICGTTVALLFIYDDKYLIVNAGDSRIYRHCKGKLTQESVDHVFGTEAKIAGTMTDKEINSHKNKNKLTSAVGCKEQFKMHIKTAPLTDSSFFICTDGVYKYCSDKLIKKIFAESDNDKLADMVRTVVEGNGAGDNFSYIKIDVGDPHFGSGFFLGGRGGIIAVCAGVLAVLCAALAISRSGNNEVHTGDVTESSISESLSSETTCISVPMTEESTISDTETITEVSSEEKVFTLAEEYFEENTEMDAGEYFVRAAEDMDIKALDALKAAADAFDRGKYKGELLSALIEEYEGNDDYEKSKFFYLIKGFADKTKGLDKALKSYDIFYSELKNELDGGEAIALEHYKGYEKYIDDMVCQYAAGGRTEDSKAMIEMFTELNIDFSYAKTLIAQKEASETTAAETTSVSETTAETAEEAGSTTDVPETAEAAEPTTDVPEATAVMETTVIPDVSITEDTTTAPETASDTSEAETSDSESTAVSDIDVETAPL